MITSLVPRPSLRLLAAGLAAAGLLACTSHGSETAPPGAVGLGASAEDLAAMLLGNAMFFGMTDPRNAAIGQLTGLQLTFDGDPFAADDGLANGQDTAHDRALALIEETPRSRTCTPPPGAPSLRWMLAPVTFPCSAASTVSGRLQLTSRAAIGRAARAAEAVASDSPLRSRGGPGSSGVRHSCSSFPPASGPGERRAGRSSGKASRDV